MDYLTRTSLIGEGRQHAQVLQEALNQAATPNSDDKDNMNEQPLRYSASTTKEQATASLTRSSFNGGGGNDILEETDSIREDQCNIAQMKREGGDGSGAA